MTDTGKFICSICLSFLGPPTLMCVDCSTTWHTSCIEKWHKTAASCPSCRSATPAIRNRIFDDLIDFVTQDDSWKCEHCSAKVEDRKKLGEHFALCPILNSTALEIALKETNVVWKLARDAAPLGYMQLTLPRTKKVKSLLIDVPDLREKPEQLQFLLDIQPHPRHTNRFQLSLRQQVAGEYNLRFIGVIEVNDKPTIFSVHYTASPTVLCTFTGKSKIMLWIYAI